MAAFPPQFRITGTGALEYSLQSGKEVDQHIQFLNTRKLTDDEIKKIKNIIKNAKSILVDKNQSIKKIFNKHLPTNKNIKNLQISNCCLDDELSDALCNLFQTSTKLKKIEINACPTQSPKTALNIATALRQCTSLRELHVDAEIVKDISYGLCLPLETLTLTEEAVNFKQLGIALQNHPTLTTLLLTDVDTPTLEEFHVFASALNQNTQLKNLLLHLYTGDDSSIHENENSSDDKDLDTAVTIDLTYIQPFADMLRMNTTLNSFNFTCANLTNEALDELFSAIAGNTHLKELSLDESLSSLERDFGTYIKFLLTTNKTLEKLTITNCSDKTVNQIAEVLSSNTHSCHTLVLGCRYKAIGQITEALKSNKKLETFVLLCDGKKPENHLINIAKAFKFNTTLKKFAIHSNDYVYSSEEICSFFENLPEFCFLNTINIIPAKIGENYVEEGQRIAKSLKNNESLHIFHTNPSPDEQQVEEFTQRFNKWIEPFETRLIINHTKSIPLTHSLLAPLEIENHLPEAATVGPIELP